MAEERENKISKRLRMTEGRDWSNNGLEAYEEYLNFPTKEYVDKQVLDVGAGWGGRFEKEAENRGVKVVSINPELRKKGSRDERRKYGDGEPHLKSVAALAQQLPFADESFEAVASLCAVPRFLENKIEEYQAAFSEMLRVLKAGGEIYVYPLDFEKIEGRQVVDVIKSLGQVDKVEVFEKDHNGGQTKKGLVIDKK